MPTPRSAALVLLLSSSLILAGCGGIKGEAKYPTGLDRAATGDDNIYAKPKSILGPDGLSIFGGKKKDKSETGIGVNSYLWRAALDTISFMPLASADPFGGVIITDWYSAPDAQDERVKLNILILSAELKANGIEVKTFRQERVKGEWRDASVADSTNTALEDTILTRARQMRIAGLASEK